MAMIHNGGGGALGLAKWQTTQGAFISLAGAQFGSIYTICRHGPART
jgi:hypothetical protein